MDYGSNRTLFPVNLMKLVGGRFGMRAPSFYYGLFLFVVSLANEFTAVRGHAHQYYPTHLRIAAFRNPSAAQTHGYD